MPSGHQGRPIAHHVRVLPSGKTSTISRIVTLEADLDEAVGGQLVTLTLADETDSSRGDYLPDLLICPPHFAQEIIDTLKEQAARGSGA